MKIIDNVKSQLYYSLITACTNFTTIHFVIFRPCGLKAEIYLLEITGKRECSEWMMGKIKYKWAIERQKRQWYWQWMC